jgi:hypothetical protein
MALRVSPTRRRSFLQIFGPRPLTPLFLSLLHRQRVDKAGPQEAAPVVTKYLGFCDVVVIESCPKVRVLAHIAPEVTSTLHPDRPLHDVEAEQLIGGFLVIPLPPPANRANCETLQELLPSLMSGATMRQRGADAQR